MRSRATIVLTVLLGVSVMLSGCIAAAAGAAAGAGTYAWVSGKLTFTTPHTVVRSHEATLAAFKQLGIIVVKDEASELGGTIEGKTDTGQSVVVDIEPQGSNITQFQVRVGFFGNHDKERMVADAIKRNL